MPFDLTAPLPSVVLYYNCTAVFEAVSPTDGSIVSGVKVLNPALYGVNLQVTDSGDTGGTIPDGAGPQPLYVVDEGANEPTAA